MRKSEFETGGSRQLQRSERGYNVGNMRLGEPELFSSFLPALPIDRNCRVQLVERGDLARRPRGVTYDENLRRSVHEWDSREAPKSPVALRTKQLSRGFRLPSKTPRNRVIRESRLARATEERGRFRSLLISL